MADINKFLYLCKILASLGIRTTEGVIPDHNLCIFVLNPLAKVAEGDDSRTVAENASSSPGCCISEISVSCSLSDNNCSLRISLLLSLSLV